VVVVRITFQSRPGSQHWAQRRVVWAHRPGAGRSGVHRLARRVPLPRGVRAGRRRPRGERWAALGSSPSAIRRLLARRSTLSNCLT